MCGIVGFVDFNKQTSLKLLQAMNNTMKHRGPDGNGEEFFETSKCNVGLGQNRLSIIDLSEKGKQPMQYKNLTIVFNGEIYNFNEIKDELIKAGHKFESKSDTEVILHAFDSWGTNAVHKFVGMFSFVIYNMQANSITCIRDRAGVKPFYYYKKNGLFLFASELKAFHKHPQFEKKVNTDSVAAFMQFGYVPTPNCIFNDTYKLKPGNILEYDLTNDHIKINTFWHVDTFYNKPKLNINYNDALKETERIIEKACNYRMVSDVPVGIFLSGGYDSSLVTALIQKNSTEKIKTFTIGIEDERLNEAKHAKAVANYLGTDHTEHYCSINEALEIVPTLPFYYDEPFADSSAIPTMLVSKIARKQVTVALSADAGDEIFAGYNRYEFGIKFSPKINNLPKVFRTGLHAILNAVPATAIPKFGKQELFNSRYSKLKAIIKNPNGEEFLNSIVKKFSDKELESIFKLKPKNLKSFFNESLSSKDNMLDSMMATDYKTYMLDDILQKIDRAGMSVSLEGREPLLDQNIIEWAATLPNDFKYKNGVKKRILKDIVHQYVPKEIMDRPKMGFAIPINSWLQNELKSFVFDYINEVEMEKQGIFNSSYVSGLLSSYYNGRTENAEKIWYLLMFQMWYKQWM